MSNESQSQVKKPGGGTVANLPPSLMNDVGRYFHTTFCFTCTTDGTPRNGLLKKTHSNNESSWKSMKHMR